MKDLRKAKTVDDVSKYVQRYARFYKDFPRKLKQKYAVSHPSEYGSKSVFSDDTWDLVIQLCTLYNIPVEANI